VTSVVDFSQYWIHRAFHRVPLLWRFHAVHHSSEELDWIAGSRLHLLDIAIVRAVSFVPVFVFGFAPGAVLAYLTFVSFHAVFIHANLRFNLRWLEPLVVTPRFHHFQHADEPEAIDNNFAVHLPIFDHLFGTAYLPDARWPERYGLAGAAMPSGWLAQLLAPFRRASRSDDRASISSRPTSKK
jgi:sterol desaturase/sphingolipid hydroxylase (fatty acid hydroxylase superfamily)